MMQQMMAGTNGLENPGDGASAAAASVANPFLEMMQQMMSKMGEPEATPSTPLTTFAELGRSPTPNVPNGSGSLQTPSNSSEDDNGKNNDSEPFMNLEAE